MPPLPYDRTTTMRKEEERRLKRTPLQERLEHIETLQRKQFYLMIRRYNCPSIGRSAALRQWKAAMLAIEESNPPPIPREDGDDDEDTDDEPDDSQDPGLAVVVVPFLQDSAKLEPDAVGPQARQFMEGLAGLQRFTQTAFHLHRMMKLAQTMPGFTVQGGALVLRRNP